MKKKMMSLALAVVMCLSLCVPAMATLESTDFTSQELQNIDVTNQKIQNYMENRLTRRMIDQGSLPMTAIRQETSYNCGAATSCMVATTMGIGNYTQAEMGTIVGTTTDGTSSDGIRTGLNSLLSSKGRSERYEKVSTSNASLASSIIYSINDGVPVIMSVKQMPLYRSSGHFITVCGYRSGFAGTSSVNEATICDCHPTYYGKYTYDISVLEAACNSNAGIFLRAA
ncbi:C39 family peptidase [Oscillibacter sp.]|uniref:C39 family peptidase n=1 Tax=Oscillibacter sp. TaxID=1945593 RepID=UPI00289CAE92|nr:C39 family peptidase [Oscillibacter sp.]